MVIMVIDMKENEKMVNEMEKAFIIIKVVIDMKSIIEMVKKKEKVFFIIIGNLLKRMYMKVIIEMMKKRKTNLLF